MTGVRLSIYLAMGLSAEPTAQDQAIADGLRDLNNRAAAVHNAGDAAGGLRIYEGGLTALRPMLAHRADVQQILSDGWRAAEQESDPSRRGHALHKAIAEARQKLLKQAAPPPGPTTLPGPTPVTSIVPLNAAGKLPLWDRLGGEIPIKFCVEECVDKFLRHPDIVKSAKFTPEPGTTRQIKIRLLNIMSDLFEGTKVNDSVKTLKEWQTEILLTETEFEIGLTEFRLAMINIKTISPGDVQAACAKIRDAWNEAKGEKPKP